MLSLETGRAHVEVPWECDTDCILFSERAPSITTQALHDLETTFPDVFFCAPEENGLRCLFIQDPWVGLICPKHSRRDFRPPRLGILQAIVLLNGF